MLLSPNLFGARTDQEQGMEAFPLSTSPDRVQSNCMSSVMVGKGLCVQNFNIEFALSLMKVMPVKQAQTFLKVFVCGANKNLKKVLL